MTVYPKRGSSTLIPEEARRRKAWVVFRFEDRDGKRTKVPYNPRTGRRAASNRPNTWTTFEEASQAPGYDGFGYSLSPEDDFFLLDLDGHRDPETGEITPEARRLIAPFEGKAYIEASASGRGIHVFGRGSKPGAEWCRRNDLGIELYDWGRPVVFTGKVLASLGSTSELADCQAELEHLYFDAMPEHLKNPRTQGGYTPPAEPVDLPDDKLLQKAASSKYGDEFRALFSGDISAAGGDHSSADYRLLKTLMYWTGGDEARALDLFDRSALARRPKWRRADYRHRTARKARLACTSFYQPNGTEGQRATAGQGTLAAGVADLRRRWWEFDWARLVGTGKRPNSMRGHSCRDVAKALIDAAARGGKITAGGLRVSIGRRTLALRAATSLRTVHKAIRHLEAEGWLEFEPPASEEKPGSYLLRANLHQVLYQHTESQGSGDRGAEKGGGEDLRSPRLRWSYVARVWTPEGFEYEYIKRLGKIRCAVLDALDRLPEGAATIDALAGLYNKRPYDLRTRTLPMLEEAGIITVAGELVSLTEGWLEALERERELKGETAAAERDERHYERQREAYRHRHKIKADRAPTDEDLAPGREARLKAREVDRLVTQGMARHVARAAVFKDSDPFGGREDPQPDGCITELEAIVRRPAKVGDIYQHRPDCPCEWCVEDPQPRYAQIRGTA